MRPQRFQEFAVNTFRAGKEVTNATPWTEQTKRPFGVKVHFSTGAQLWLGITAMAAPGEDYSQPETPVSSEPPADMAVPELYVNGKVSIAKAELYLAALINNAGSAEVARVYGYSDRPTPAMHPGLGVDFHNGSKIQMVFVHAVRAGQDSPTAEYDLPTEV
jgi:hypothetical protein